VKRASRWQRSPGWIRSGVATAVVVCGFVALAALPVGWVLAHVSDLIGGVR